MHTTLTKGMKVKGFKGLEILEIKIGLDCFDQTLAAKITIKEAGVDEPRELCAKALLKAIDSGVVTISN